MQTTNATNQVTLLGYLPEHIQSALQAYGVETNLAPESVVKLAIRYFLESASISVGLDDKDPTNVPPNQGILAHLGYVVPRINVVTNSHSINGMIAPTLQSDRRISNSLTTLKSNQWFYF